MDVSSTFRLNAGKIRPIDPIKPLDGNPEKIKSSDSENMFESVFQAAVSNINTTNRYLSDAENEEMKLALGQADNPHDLAIAVQKASSMLQYTVAVRDKFMEAYKELMNMQF